MKAAVWMLALVVVTGCGTTGPCDEIIGTATITEGVTKVDAEARAAERTGVEGWTCTVSASDEASGAWIVWTCERCP